MRTWPMHPIIYEINTWVWLHELGQKYGRPVDLATVPPEEWDRLASLGFDAVWFMGVRERSPTGIAIYMRNQGLIEDFRRVLPDFAVEDNAGSRYCVRGASPRSCRSSIIRCQSVIHLSGSMTAPKTGQQ